MQEEMKIVEAFLKECEEEFKRAQESGELQTFMSQTELSSKIPSVEDAAETKSLEGASLSTDVSQFREIKPPPTNRFRKK